MPQTEVRVDDLRADLQSSFIDLSGADDKREAETQKTSTDVVVRTEQEDTTQKSRERDATGRFAPKVTAQDEVLADGQRQQKEGQVTETQVAEKKPVVREDANDKAPASWKPTEREHWKDLKPELKAAIRRRDQEVDAALRNSTESRRFQQAFVDVLRPFEGMVAAENTNFLHATQNLFQTANLLRNGKPEQKARAVADMIKQFGIDVETLDTYLSQDMQHAPATSQIERLLDQRLAPIMQAIQPRQQPQYQEVNQEEVQQTLVQFMNDPKNEFINEVGPYMADILMAAANRGELISLQDAYSRATLAHPEVSKVIQQRQAGQTTAQLDAAARRALNASASVSDTGAPSRGSQQDDDDGSIRSALTASIRDLSKSTRM